MDIKKQRILYIFEAGIEYFISLLMIGAYLAKLTTYIGMSDSLSGVLIAFVSLGGAFQVFALFLVNKRPVKKWVTLFHIINQLCFAFVYLIPLFNVSKTTKIIFFIVFLILGYIISNIINAPKTDWFMNGIGQENKGKFTANKEIFSLIGGMIFSSIMGLIIDYYEALGKLSVAFTISAIAIFILMLGHTLILLLTKEHISENTLCKIKVKDSIKSLLSNKEVLKIILITVLWYVANYATTPFYGTYQIKELGFNMAFVSILAIVYALVRSIASVWMGRYGDKYSFVDLFYLCFFIGAFSFLINIFTTPSNGKIMFTLHYIFYAIANAGIGNASLNLIFEKVEKNQKMSGYALQQTLAGIAGFLTTTLVSVLVAHIQANNNMIFGIHMYAQQFISIIGFLITLIIIIYIKLVLKKKSRRKV